MMPTQPCIPLADPQYGNKPNTWANKTIATRFPNTARKVLAENEFSPEIQDRIQALIADIPAAGLRPIVDPGAPDLDAWNHCLQPYLGQNWFQPPWFFTEHYFYRRILEAIGYFQSGEGGGADPFIYQKRKGLEVTRPAIRQWVERSTCLLADASTAQNITNRLYLDLWGNQADLSLWPAEGRDKPDHTDLDQARAHILVDDVHKVTRYLLNGEPLSRIDFLIDNAGYELVSDLAFAGYLLTSGLATTIRFHVKAHPTFVSDAMIKDVDETIQFLCQNENPLTPAIGAQLKNFVADKRLQIRENWFWTSPRVGWELPSTLRSELSESKLVISKGDAHYRRLLGDRHWPHTTKFEEVLCYFPAPLVTLRTLKSELIVGLQPGQSARVATQDPDWLVNGRWGLIQALFPP